VEPLLWASAFLLGLVVLWLLDRRESLREIEHDVADRMERRLIHALVVVLLSVPAAYLLPKVGVELDVADLVAGAILAAVSWVLTAEIREGL